MKILKKTVHWLLVLVIAAYVLSGYGITDWQTLEPLTLGLMGKARAMQIHDDILIVPLVALIAVHLYLMIFARGK